MGFPLFDIIQTGMQNNIFGDITIMMLFVGIFLIMILGALKFDKLLILPLLFPIIFVLADYVKWLFVIIMIMIGFGLGHAIIKLFNQQN